MAKSLFDGKKLLAAVEDFSKPIRTFECIVPDEWIDFNGHLNEARYLESFSYGSDSILLLFGCDDEYISRGQSYFTAETHIIHLDEVGLGEPIYVTTQILLAEGKRLHVFHRLFHERPENGEDVLLATGEQMLLHVDLSTRKTSIPEAEMLAKMELYGGQHKTLPLPDTTGRGIGQRK